MQVLDSDESGSLSFNELCMEIKKLVRPVCDLTAVATERKTKGGTNTNNVDLKLVADIMICQVCDEITEPIPINKAL